MLDLATIVYRREIPLLKLQARSIAHFLKAEDFGEIFVVAQDSATADTREAFEQEVLPHYGKFQSKVRFLPATDFMNYSGDQNGWRQQQALKLLLARKVTAPNFVSLDAKNHFVAPISSGQFINTEGKLRTFRTGKHGSLHVSLERCAAYFGVDLNQHMDHLMPTTTPYVLSKRMVLALIDEIEAREGMGFSDFFLTPRRYMTEFFLYYAFLLKTLPDIQSLYFFGPRYSVTYFNKWPSAPETLERAISRLAEPDVSVFGLHSRRLSRLDDRSKEAIIARWTSSGLFDSSLEAREFFAYLQNSFAEEKVEQSDNST